MTAQPPVMDGHMLSLGKNPQPHIVQHIQALTDTHRHRSAPYILESIYLKKKNHSLLQSPENPTKPYVQLFTEKRGMERLRKPAEMLNSNHFTDSLMPLF